MRQGWKPAWTYPNKDWLCERISLFFQDSAFSSSAILVAVPADHDISLFAPWSTPRVLHFPVVLSAHAAVSNDQHTMIKSGSAASGLFRATQQKLTSSHDVVQTNQDATFVELECGLVGFNGDGDWSLRDSIHQRLFAIVRHVLVSCDGVIFLTARAGSTWSISGRVTVFLFAAETAFGFHVFESVV